MSLACGKDQVIGRSGGGRAFWEEVPAVQRHCGGGDRCAQGTEGRRVVEASVNGEGGVAGEQVRGQAGVRCGGTGEPR